MLVVVLALALFATILGLAFGLPSSSEGEAGSKREKVLPPVEAGEASPIPTLRKFPRAAVASDGRPCATVAKELLAEGGSAVDAAVGALVCNGLYNPQSMGLGGGFLMTVYSRGTGLTEVLNARETAPAFANPNMYAADPSLSSKGPLAVAVPGEIAGYWAARKRYGNSSISWERILGPSIRMAREGIPVSNTLADAIADKNWLDPTLKETFTDPSTGAGWVEKSKHRRPRLAASLEALAEAGNDGDSLFYKGNLGKALVQDLQQQGGNITMADLNAYTADWLPGLEVDLARDNLTLHSVPPPGSGAVLAAVLNIMQQMPLLRPGDEVLFYHHLVEAFKWAYAERSKLGDPQDDQITSEVRELVRAMTSQAWAEERAQLVRDNVTSNEVSYYGGQFNTVDEHGTAHLSVVAPNGDAVAVTSTINQSFGCGLMSTSTGIIYNDQMDDFSFPEITNGFGLPPSPNNFPRPGKRPMSSMCPTIITDSQGIAKLVIGASGGTKITTSVALVALLHLERAKGLAESVASARLHHQLSPMEVEHESSLPKEIQEGLRDRGHILKDTGSAGSVVQAIARDCEILTAAADGRKSGGVDGF